MIDDLGPAWIAEPSVYDNIEGCDRLTANLKTRIQVGEKFYGPRALYIALQMKARSSERPNASASTAMPNGRCRIDGGRSAGAPRGERNGNWGGRFKTPEAPAERRKLRELIRQMRITMDELP